MEFFNQTYIAIRGPTGAPQNAVDTIGRLSDRLSPATLLQDRRAAVLSLKGLARDCKQEVGDRTLPGLLQVLQNDADIDADIAKAVLETLIILCETEEDTTTRNLGLGYSDAFLSTPAPLHVTLALLADPNFQIRFPALQLLSSLLHNRRQLVQGHFLTASNGPAAVITTLNDQKDIVKNEAIIMVQALISQNSDIQKILAFEGAFETLMKIISAEGGIEGAAVSRDSLLCIDGLLRFNASNQSYFRELKLPQALCNLILYPFDIQPEHAAPQEFALQFWDRPKTTNVSVVIGILGLLIGSKGSTAQESSALIRCLVEISLASNAPTALKTQALRLLPTSLDFPLSEIILTPYMPVPETNGEEWDRLEPASALDALIELALHGEYNGLSASKRDKEGLDLRAAALSVFENFVRRDEVRQAIMQAMLPQDNSVGQASSNPLLHNLASPPIGSPLDMSYVTSTHIAALLFAHLLRSSSRAKTAARAIMPSIHASGDVAAGDGQFFTPADGVPPESALVAEVEEDEAPQSLLQILTENLSLSFLSRSRSHATSSDRDSREWDRITTGYLCLLSVWLWDDPGSVRDFLDAGGLTILVEPINQTSDSDDMVPALSTFLLGICYEYNLEPGEITRSIIHPIITRLGVDALIGRMMRLREDERFKTVGPDNMILSYTSASHLQLGTNKADKAEEGEIWFDWAFVDFWKSNYYTIQRGLSNGPNTLSSSSSQNAETAMLIGSLRETIRKQAKEIEDLQAKLKSTVDADKQERERHDFEIAAVKADLQASEGKIKEVEKEQEDLLVLLDEVSSKRKRDKERMRAADLEVSEDEADVEDE